MSRFSTVAEIGNISPETQNVIKLFIADIEQRFRTGSYGRLQIQRGIKEALAIATVLHLAGEESNVNVKESLGWHSQQGNGPARSEAHELAERSNLTPEEREKLAKHYPALYRQWVRQNVAAEQDN